MSRWLLALSVAGFGFVGSELWAEDKPASEATVAKVPLNEHEQAFADLLTNAALVGTFTVERDNDSAETPRHKERYVIKSVNKVADRQWIVNSQIVYGELDVTVPVPVQVDWAGDTPVLSVTDLTIPLVGSEFTARVMFYDGRYAGTWRHGKVGGLMFGRVETADEKPAKSTPASDSPAKSKKSGSPNAKDD